MSTGAEIRENPVVGGVPARIIKTIDIDGRKNI
jgi:acetyltransferase-like isoleucine patch superfamily enzyme